jgi:hypothetical protein
MIRPAGRDVPTVHVRREDHDAVKQYYKTRGVDVRLIADPSVIWPACEPPPEAYDRYSELED